MQQLAAQYAEVALLTSKTDRETATERVRHARQLIWEQIAAVSDVGQASIAKLERRTDMYLSTLRRFVEAMGRELEIVVRFPDQPLVRLRGIGELAEAVVPPDAT